MQNGSFYRPAVHAGEDRSDNHGALSVPIYPASVFAFTDADEGDAIHDEEKPGHYSQMRSSGGMIDFDVGSVEAGQSLANAVKLCTLAASLGEIELLVRHSASMINSTISPDRPLKAGITDGRIRLSVGIEDIGDLKGDITQALESINL